MFVRPRYWVITLNGSAVSSSNGTVSVPLEATAAIIDLGTTGIVLSDADAGNISAVRRCAAARGSIADTHVPGLLSHTAGADVLLCCSKFQGWSTGLRWTCGT